VSIIACITDVFVINKILAHLEKKYPSSAQTKTLLPPMRAPPTTRFLLGGLAPSNFFTDPAFLQKGWKSTCLRNAFLSIYRIKPIPNAIKS
jgi:hypothetical protein